MSSTYVSREFLRITTEHRKEKTKADPRYYLKNLILFINLLSFEDTNLCPMAQLG